MQLEQISGIGPKMLENLAKLGINSLEELITYYPYKYLVLRPNSIYSLENGGVLVGKIDSIARVVYIKKNLNYLTFRVNSNNNLVKIIIFNRAFLKSKLKIGSDITLIGKYDKQKNTFTASDIRFYKLTKTLIEPKYHLNSGIKNNNFLKIINNALVQNFDLVDYIPVYLSKTYNFLDKKNAVKIMHKPLTSASLKQAKLRLIYEELFVFTFKINYLKFKNTINSSSLKRDIDCEQIKSFIDQLPFALTSDQTTAVEEIINDFNSKKRMNRLILGDVGSGKTIVAFIALYANYLNSYQAAMMAPTEILAKQHYEAINNIFSNYNIKTALLIGSLTKKEKVKIKSDILNNKIDILIGTHAILSEDLEFKNLGLVITDEQHRFGVNQRSCLQNKGQKPDVLYMSATPIPRTYALSLYGDMDTSLIKTKPKGRKSVKTIVKKNAEIKDVLHQVLEQLKMGHQIYIVAPTIDQNSNELENVNQLKEKFNKAFNNIVKIGVLHGKQKPSLKEQIMLDFKNKKYNILISTTVIEVGIDVENATMIIIFNAERFGLATLHQLRGRVGRNSFDSFCYLISDQNPERLKVLESSNDGFYISEQDFKLRGEGDLFGTLQSGDMNFKIANLQRDYKILIQAKKDSLEFLKNNIESNFKNEKIYSNIISKMDLID